ncbi:hypothetical protein [Flavobacterium sp.]|uniref:hypothetical protein n=1 Tax=Flavobacterium sp. TaxID=239 RepID=UPI0032667D3E
MKFIITILLIPLLSFSTVETKVFICGIRGAKKYHLSEFCRGFGACKHEIVKVNLKEAKGFGLTLCGWED